MSDDKFRPRCIACGCAYNGSEADAQIEGGWRAVMYADPKRELWICGKCEAEEMPCRAETIAFPETDIGSSVPTDNPGILCLRCGRHLCSKECIEAEERELDEYNGPQPRKFV